MPVPTFFILILIVNRHIKKSIYRMTIICISSVQISNITLFAVDIDRFVIIWVKICFLITCVYYIIPKLNIDNIYFMETHIFVV